MRCLRVPLERACVPLVVRVPQFENHCLRRNVRIRNVRILSVRHSTLLSMSFTSAYFET